jgi:flavin reductase (DIM6/NTAB) family NADH-FMN oxidoreductase RutF
VAESLIHFECVLDRIVDINASEPGGSNVVFGRVVHAHFDDSVLVGTDKIDPAALHPIGRMAGASYADVTSIFDMPRPVVE